MQIQVIILLAPTTPLALESKHRAKAKVKIQKLLDDGTARIMENVLTTEDISKRLEDTNSSIIY